jgi:glycosyltransferase involved in cell wall biosynthesis
MGGMQKHSRLMAEYLARSGQNVMLFHYAMGPDLPTEEEVRSQFSSEANAHLNIRTFRYPTEDIWPGHYLRAQKAISKEYTDALLREKSPPSLVFAKGFMAWDILKRRKNFDASFSIAVKFHGMNMFQKQPDWKGELVKYMLRSPVRQIMNQADFVFSYGGKISEIIHQELKTPDKLVELPSGVDDHWLHGDVFRDALNQPKKPRRFLFVGRWDRLKGLPELFEVLRKRIDFHMELSLVGPIPQGHGESDDRLVFLGPIHNSEELKKVYDRHEVLICPSISEGMPNVIMEAMSRGLAVIATDVGATATLVNPQVGWLISPQNAAELEGAIEEAISDDGLGEKQRFAAEKMKQEFTWSVVAKRFLEWYIQVL